MRRLLPAVVVASALCLSSCAGAPSSPGVAGVPSSATATGSSGTAAGPGALTSQLLAYSRCMRSHGVPDFPDPTGGGFRVGPGFDPSSPAVAAARSACQKDLPNGGLPGGGPPPSRQAVANMLRISQCMRAHGILGFPDPRTSVPPDPFGAGGVGVISDIDGVILVFPSSLDTGSPQFAKAAEECRFPLHNH